MRTIHINRARQNLGHFSPEEVAEGLRSGRFHPEDLAWQEGMETWKPLSTFTDLPAPDETVPPTLAPGSPVEDLQPMKVAPEWERESAVSWFVRLYETVLEVLGSPRATFAAMPVTGGLRKPLTFLMLLGSTCGIISIGYQLAFQMIAPKEAARPEVSQHVMMGIYIGMMIFMPLLVALGSFISSAILHGCLWLVGGTPKSFEATYRVVCYANGATSVLLLIPMCGSFVQAIWNLCAVVVGFREVHCISTGKAILAVMLPVIICCGLVFTALALGVAIPAASHLGR